MIEKTTPFTQQKEQVNARIQNLEDKYHQKSTLTQQKIFFDYVNDFDCVLPTQ